jgi:hypothetical protein
MTGGPTFPQKTQSVQDIRDFLSSLQLAEPQPPWVDKLLDYLETVEETATHVDAQIRE